MYEQQTKEQSFNQPQHQPDQSQQPPRGWWSRNWRWFVPVSSVVVVLSGVGFFVAIIALVFGVMKNTEVYETALFEAQTNQEVISYLGNRIEDGMFMTGNMEVSPGSGYADIVIPISGQKGSASLYVQAEKVAGSWQYSTMQVNVHDSDISIDLLED